VRKITLFALVSFLLFNISAGARSVSKAEFMEDVNTLFLKEDYSAFIRETETEVGRIKLARKEKKEVFYLMGLSYMKLGSFVKARASFSDILGMKGEEFDEDAHIGIADSYFHEKNYVKAIKSYKTILNMYPESERLAGAYHNLGISYKAVKNTQKADYYLNKVKREYSSSFEAESMASRPEKTENYYIVQLGAFRSLKNAKKLVRRLSRKKYDSYIQKIKSGGKTLYRVRGGKFSNKDYAMKLQRKLRRDGFQVKIIEE